jgi:hypothetical protein
MKPHVRVKGKGKMMTCVLTTGQRHETSKIPRDAQRGVIGS